MESQLKDCIEELAMQLTARNLMLATAESCTGGGIAAACTDLPGSSEWFEGGVVSYSNAVKQTLLSVNEFTIKNHGAVSQQTALAMATGVRKLLNVDLAVSVTGIAGPGGGSNDKPVGTVWFSWAGPQKTECSVFEFIGSREEVRKKAVVQAIEGTLNYMQKYL